MYASGYKALDPESNAQQPRFLSPGFKYGLRVNPNPKPQTDLAKHDAWSLHEDGIDVLMRRGTSAGGFDQGLNPGSGLRGFRV